MRKIFELKSYDNSDRKKGGIKYSKLFKKITDQNINVLFAGMALFDDVRKWNKDNVNNYLSVLYGNFVLEQFGGVKNVVKAPTEIFTNEPAF